MSGTYTLKRSPRFGKKWRIITPQGENVDFGASGYSDYTKHKNYERKERYVKRHQKRENWSKTGISTAGFWSRWLLWNLPSLTDSIKDIEAKFNIKIQYKA